MRGYVEHYQFRFPVAMDPDWQTLKRWWLDGHERSWTNVSFLIDRRGGVIRHVHLGGKLAPDQRAGQRMASHLTARKLTQ